MNISETGLMSKAPVKKAKPYKPKFVKHKKKKSEKQEKTYDL